MRDIIKLGFYLLVIGALAGLSVSYVNKVTEPIIAGHVSEAKQTGLQEVYPDADSFQDETSQYVDASCGPEIKEVNVAYKGSEPAGVIYIVESVGYGGPISIMVGFDIAQKEVSRIKILTQSETPGLGAQCTEPWFLERFRGKSAASPLEVTKQEPAGDNQIAAITASTVTSKAVTKGVNTAREHFLKHFSD